ncbi:MAG: hypothetical protein NXI10_11225 [bacterium]|nr:hypothetical protein [bacterium]
MRIVAVLFFGLLSFGASAQMYMDQSDTTSFGSEVGVKSLGDYGASAVQNGVTNKMFLGGFIDSTLKNNSLSRHSAVNRIGINSGGEVYYRNSNKKLFKKKNWGYEISAGVNYFGGALYGRDAFDLLFFGNQSYIGDTMFLSGMDANFTAMQKVGFGFYDIKSKSSVRFNVYNISSRIDADFRDFEILQSADGQELTLMMDGDVTVGQSASFNQGVGFGIDFDFRIPISWVKGDNAYLQFKSQNLGFAYMYEAQKKYSFDTTIVFDGFRFEQLLADNGYFNDSISILDTLGIRSQDVNSVFLLPGFIQVSKMVDNQSEKQLQSFFGLRVYPTLIFSPLGFAGADYRFNEHIHAGASVTFGGFSGLRFGAYGQFNWDKFGLGIGSDNFSGFMRSGGNGTSMYVNAVCRF